MISQPNQNHGLKNSYYILRHGQSLANIDKIIVSDPENGLTGYGLSDIGKLQVADSVAACQDLNGQTIIYSSDFLRTRQTARIAAEKLKAVHEIRFSKLLRERFFGSWELTADSNYQRVWDDDPLGQPPKNNVESVDSVLKRALLCLEQIEANHLDQRILLVAHGDTLQILLSFFNALPPGRHREIDPVGVAEIRRI